MENQSLDFWLEYREANSFPKDVSQAHCLFGDNPLLSTDKHSLGTDLSRGSAVRQLMLPSALPVFRISDASNTMMGISSVSVSDSAEPIVDTCSAVDNPFEPNPIPYDLLHEQQIATNPDFQINHFTSGLKSLDTLNESSGDKLSGYGQTSLLALSSPRRGMVELGLQQQYEGIKNVINNLQWDERSWMQGITQQVLGYPNTNVYKRQRVDNDDFDEYNGTGSGIISPGCTSSFTFPCGRLTQMVARRITLGPRGSVALDLSSGTSASANTTNNTYHLGGSTGSASKQIVSQTTNEAAVSVSAPKLTTLNECMAKSEKTQEALQKWDKDNGLPRSHSCTMVKTSRSRRQLIEGRILPKWDGSPSMTESGPLVRRRKKKIKTTRVACTTVDA
jgi:hypothetical protein